MRINFNSFCLSLGGGNRVILQLADALVEKGHYVTITHMGVPSYYSWYGKPRCKVINLNPSLFLRAIKKYYLRKRNFDYDLESLMAKVVPDCDVNVATGYVTVLPTLYSGKGKMAYLVQHYAPLLVNEREKKIKAKLTYDLPLKKLCVSHWLAEKVNGIFIGNGIDLNTFKFLDLERKYDAMIIDRPASEWKGKTAKVAKELQARGYKIKLVHNVSTSELVNYYNQSNAFIYLSEIAEGFGLCNLEAMATHTPVITTQCTEYCLDKKNSQIIQSGTITDVVNQIVNALTFLEQNPNEKQTIVENGLKTVEKHDFNLVVNRFLDAVKN